MNKFKVGDTVVLIDTSGYTSVKKGDIGEITSCEDYFYIVSIKRLRFMLPLVFRENEIELKDKYDTLLWRELDE